MSPHEALREAARLSPGDIPPGLIPCAYPVFVAAAAAGCAVRLQEFADALEAAGGKALRAAAGLARKHGAKRVHGDYRPGDVAVVRVDAAHACALVTGSGPDPVCGVLAKGAIVTGRFRIAAAWRLQEGPALG